MSEVRYHVRNRSGMNITNHHNWDKPQSKHGEDLYASQCHATTLEEAKERLATLSEKYPHERKDLHVVAVYPSPRVVLRGVLKPFVPAIPEKFEIVEVTE